MFLSSSGRIGGRFMPRNMGSNPIKNFKLCKCIGAVAQRQPVIGWKCRFDSYHLHQIYNMLCSSNGQDLWLSITKCEFDSRTEYQLYAGIIAASSKRYANNGWKCRFESYCQHQINVTIVYRSGYFVLSQMRWVRFPLGVPNFRIQERRPRE